MKNPRNKFHCWMRKDVISVEAIKKIFAKKGQLQTKRT